MPELVESHPIELQDHRRVRVLAYDDGSIRVRISDPPYWIEEAFLGGGRGGHAILKLVRKPPQGDPIT